MSSSAARVFAPNTLRPSAKAPRKRSSASFAPTRCASRSRCWAYCLRWRWWRCRSSCCGVEEFRGKRNGAVERRHSHSPLAALASLQAIFSADRFLALLFARLAKDAFGLFETLPDMLSQTTGAGPDAHLLARIASVCRTAVGE